MAMIQILVPALLASVGFVAIGLLVSLFSLKSQGRELLANVVSLPLFLPALFIGLSMTVDIAKGMSLPEVWRQVLFLFLYDVFFLAAAYLRFDANYME
ncbi:ABC heme exporter, inner membrane subunit B [Desulfitobacterium hafniense DCB-2]|uniref:ABC heme exporter, inner membrane subunit B n=2 Tax=Desulfitobacterium hafniense TaxID=49338 RepID=B8FZT1_DESHD|nr:ABC heme exporter, inner membrane subunit B [Desulfitobacterium hafniense DCB-2]